MQRMDLERRAGVYVETGEIDRINRKADPDALSTHEIVLNAIHIFALPDPQPAAAGPPAMSYRHLRKKESNYQSGTLFAEGVLRHDPDDVRALGFFPSVVYEWQTGGGLGYDATFFRKLDHAPRDDLHDGFRWLKRKELYLRNDDGRVFKPVTGGTEERGWYFGADADEIIEEMTLLHNQMADGGWDEFLASYVRQNAARGKTAKEILANIRSKDWTLKRVRQLTG